MFPTVTVGGAQKYLQLRPAELIEYEAQVERLLDRYTRRLQWLLAGQGPPMLFGWRPLWLFFLFLFQASYTLLLCRRE